MHDSEADGDATKAGMSQQGPLEYRQQREDNIARNKQLLAELGLAQGASSLVEELAKKGKVKVKGKGKAIQYVPNFFAQVEI
jgi:hypothetical protein